MPTGTVAAEEKPALRRAFSQAVNMTPARLARWLDERTSRSVGMRKGGEKVTNPGGREAVGHSMGRRVVELRSKRQGDLTDDDYRAMRKVVGYVHRHTAQRPDGDVTNTRWRYSLMNWGHDPLRH